MRLASIQLLDADDAFLSQILDERLTLRLMQLQQSQGVADDLARRPIGAGRALLIDELL